MPQVQVIQPIQQQPKRLRVAAYARVSSDSTDQLNSLSVQVDYYTHLIQENPNWDFAGIYADEGITGTSTKHREQFNRLLDDCRAGLIDRVLVKSASRFARNTADALASVREMKSLGVTVVFEKEGFDTETANGEMILSMICAAAQEESLSISQNTKWGMPNDTIVDLIRMLIWYDWEHSLPFQDFGDSTQCFLLRIRLSCSHPAVKALLADWQIHRTAFENGRITSSDYLEWMLQWPPTLSAPDD